MRHNRLIMKSLQQITATRRRFGRCGVWRRGNTARPGVWRVGIMAGGFVACNLVAMPAGPAFGQDGSDGGDGEASDQQPAVTAPTVDWTHGKRAHRLVERWVHAGHWGQKRPKQDGEKQPMPTIRVRGVTGVKVTLRSAGQYAGSGEAYRTKLAPLVEKPGKATDLVPLLSRAAEGALKEARQAVLNARLKALEQGIKKQSKRPTFQQVGSRLQVGLQIAATFHPISRGRDASVAQVFAGFAPGYHGLRLIGGEKTQRGAFLWPSEAVARNLGAKRQLRQLLDEAGLAFTELPTVGKPNGPTLQRFEVIHMVRPRLDLPVQRLKRSQVIMPASAIREPTIAGLSQRLARHLFGRFTDDGLIRGTFQPAKSTYEPALASSEDRALACYALTRQAARLLAGETQRPGVERRAERALAVAERLGRAQLEREAIQPNTAALVVMTLIDTPLGDADQTIRDKLADQLQALHLGKGRFRKPAKAGDNQNGQAAEGGDNARNGDDGPAQVSQPTAALITAALVAMYDQTRTDALKPIARAGLDRVWQRLQKDTKLAALPWAAIAHRRLTPLVVTDQTVPKRVKQREQVIARMIEQFERRQIIEAPELGPKDVIGGFQLNALPDGAPPAPDWHSAQVLMLVATAMRDPRLMEGERRFGLTITAGLAARFIGQLMMDEPGCYFVTGQSHALGGVRLAPWNNRLPVSASAMSLLAVDQLQAATE